jgi:hypothetical protein
VQVAYTPKSQCFGCGECGTLGCSCRQCSTCGCKHADKQLSYA